MNEGWQKRLLLVAAGVVDSLFAIFFVAAFLAVRAKSAAST